MFATASAPLRAQPYPAKSIRFLVGFPPGGGADTLARMIGKHLSQSWGRAFVIENRPGADSTIATELGVKSAPDGYTIIFVTNAHVITPFQRKLPYDPIRDIAPVTLVASGPNLLLVHPSLPVKSLKDFIALAKSKPGVLNYGSSGAGTTVHLAGELFSVMTSTKMVHVPFKGAAESLTALLSGETDLQFASLSSAIPLIKSGRLRALGVTSLKRSPSIPELATIAELGLPGYDAVAWYGIVGPAKLPADIVATIYKVALASLGQQDVKTRLFNSGVEVRTLGPEEFAKYTESEIAKWAKVVKASGARAG